MAQELVQTHHTYISLRGRTYYFRFVIPAHLRQLCSVLPREIKRSLQTDSLTDAVAMVSSKLPLLRLFKNCSKKDSLLKIYQKLSDFTYEVSERVETKLSQYMEIAKQVKVEVKDDIESFDLDIAWSQFVCWKSWSEKLKKSNQRMYDNLRLFLGNVPVDSISKRDLKAALDGISKLPRRNKKKYNNVPIFELKGLTVPVEDRVSSKYVKEHLKLCQSFFNRFLKHEKEAINVSPTEGLKWEYENKRFGCFTDAEVRQLLQKAERKPEWFKWLFLISVYTGARRGEIANLKTDDIKLCEDTNRYYFLIRSGKTKAARRTIPVHKELICRGLMDWIESKDNLLFDVASRNLNRVTDLFTSMLERKENDYGERLVFHSLRHTFITKSRAAGISDVLVQQVIGHEKRGAGQTDRYTHTFQLKDVLKVVDEVIYQVRESSDL